MTDTTSATLTHRQELFVHHYLLDLNASAAARRAGYSGKSHGSNSGELMKNPLVRERIRAGLDEIVAALKLDAISLWRKQAAVAYFDVRRMFDASGTPIPLEELDPEVSQAINVTVKTRRDGEKETSVRSPARQSALNLLTRFFAKNLELQLQACEDELREAEAAEPEALPGEPVAARSAEPQQERTASPAAQPALAPVPVAAEAAPAPALASAKPTPAPVSASARPAKAPVAAAPAPVPATALNRLKAAARSWVQAPESRGHARAVDRLTEADIFKQPGERGASDAVAKPRQAREMAEAAF